MIHTQLSITKQTNIFLKLMSGETTGTHPMPVVLKSSRTVTECNSSTPEQTGWSCSRGAVRGGRELTGIVRKLSEQPADGDELVSDEFIEKAAGTNSLSQHGSTTHTHTIHRHRWSYFSFCLESLLTSIFFRH